MLRRPEPGTFETLLQPVEVTTSTLHRLSRFALSEPFWGKQRRYRFDDPLEEEESRFGVLYCAENLPTAFAESVIHDNRDKFVDGAFEVPRQRLIERELARYWHPRRNKLILVDFTGPALKALGLNNDISSTDDYEVPQLWSRAVHEATSFDGIMYVSRQNNRTLCYALFERSGLEFAAIEALTEDDISALCKLFKVRPVDAATPDANP